jgi:hypothetical protein
VGLKWPDGFNETYCTPLALQIQTITRQNYKEDIINLLSLQWKLKRCQKQKTYMNLMEIWLFIRSRPIGKKMRENNLKISNKRLTFR